MLRSSRRRLRAVRLKILITARRRPRLHLMELTQLTCLPYTVLNCQAAQLTCTEKSTGPATRNSKIAKDKLQEGNSRMDDSVHASTTTKILAALFYAISSFSIVMVNKSILTNYNFPSVQCLGVGQMVAAVIILRTGKAFGVISFPDFTAQTPKKIFPLPLIYLGNLIAGLGGTKMLSLPMFTVLRRFSILFTMILEYFILRKKASPIVIVTVLTMIGGALVAASDDLAFDAVGYSYIFMNDIFTALNAVIMKKQLNAQDLGKYGITYYNCLLMILPACGILYWTKDFEKLALFNSWNDPQFIIQFLMSCLMGFVLMYAIAVCTAYNSALTTTVVGCLKNIFVTYIGMVFGGDYMFSWVNFIGVNLSVVGSVIYSYYSFREKGNKSQSLPSTIKESQRIRYQPRYV